MELEDVLALSISPIVVASPGGGGITAVNPVAVELFGQFVAERSVAAVSAAVAPALPTAEVALEAIQKAGGAKYLDAGCMWTIPAGGATAHVEYRATALPPGDGPDADTATRVMYQIKSVTPVSDEAVQGTVSPDEVINAVHDGVWDWYIQENYEYMSPRFWEMFGYDHEEKESNPSAWMGIINKDDLPNVLANFDEHVKSHGKVPFHNEVRYTHRDGSTVWVRCRGRVVSWAVDGKPLRMIGGHTSITKLKELAASLEASRAEAVVAARKRTMFLANMSHELRTPLNGVIACADLLADDAPAENARELVNVIHESSFALLRVINDILCFEKLSANKMKIMHEKFDAAAVVASTVSCIRKTELGRALTITVDISDGFPACLVGDGGRVRQCVTNLLGNAVKFTPPGGFVSVKLAAEPYGGSSGGEDNKEDDGDEYDKRLVSITVADTGGGIAEDQLSLLFLPFEQCDGSLTRGNQSGTGLGLAIARGMAECMGGGITATSKLGEGSAFTMTFVAPVADGAAGSPKPLASRTAPAGGVLVKPGSEVRVVAVDDHAMNLKVLLRLLSRCGCDLDLVTTFTSGDDFLKSYLAGGADNANIVLMDISMPGRDGYDVTRELRRALDASGRPQPVVVGLSAHAMDEYRAHALDAGMDDYASKPLSIDVLKTVLFSATQCSSPSFGGDRHIGAGE